MNDENLPVGRATIRISADLFFQQMHFPERTRLLEARVEDRTGMGYPELVITVSHTDLPVKDPIPEITPTWRRQPSLMFSWDQGHFERPIRGG